MPVAPSRIVNPAYHHVDKTVTPVGVIGSMKWYELSENDNEYGNAIDVSLQSLARDTVATLVEPDDIGFVIVHACANDITLILACRWRNNNEIWETVFVHRGTGDFETVAGADPTRATYCVWELEIVNAERLAWITFLRSNRDEMSLDRYLRDASPTIT